MTSAAAHTFRLISSLSSSYTIVVNEKSVGRIFFFKKIGRHLREFGRDKSEDESLVPREELERLERPRTVRVVFEIISVYVDLLEQLYRDTVVPAFAKMHAILTKKKIREKERLKKKKLEHHTLKFPLHK